MTIKEVEKKLNISRANIRFYEKEGLLKPKRNDDNEYRNYSEDDLKRLEKILLFRKCNISIENIRLLFDGSKSIDEVFKEQISVIENEVKQLEGAKIICKKLAEEKSSLDKIDTEKYINMISSEEQKGNKFYNITEDYVLATENLYQSIIENKKFKGGDKMKKGIKIGIYIASSVLMFLILVLFDFIFHKSVDWAGAIIFTSIITIVDAIGAKKYIEKKSGEKFTKKQNIKHFAITILVMIIALFGYYSIKQVYDVNKNPNSNVLEMSVKSSLINIANEKYKNDENYIYAESHKILGTEVKGDEIYVYVAANYGLFDSNAEPINNTKNTLTMIYKKAKNKEGIYELKEYKENFIPNDLKDKTDVNYEDAYFKNQLNSYINN